MSIEIRIKDYGDLDYTTKYNKPAICGEASLDYIVGLYMIEQCLTCGYNPDIETVINHEVLHLALLRIEERKAYYTLDNLCYPIEHSGLGFGLLLEKFKESEKEWQQ